MGADKLFENTPKCPQIYLPKLSAQAQKFEILMKKDLFRNIFYSADKIYLDQIKFKQLKNNI